MRYHVQQFRGMNEYGIFGGKNSNSFTYLYHLVPMDKRQKLITEAGAISSKPDDQIIVYSFKGMFYSVLKLSRHSNHLDSLIKHRFLGPAPRYPESAGLGWGLGICPSDKIPGSVESAGLGNRL